MEVKVRKVFRSGNVIGIPVKTPDHKNAGEIEEVVIDIETGRVAYAVLSFGGIFGFRDKFFAVPWEDFSFVHDEKQHYFVVDTSREKLENLPGFDKQDWPDVANSDWDREVDSHYQSTEFDSDDNREEREDAIP